MTVNLRWARSATALSAVVACSLALVGCGGDEDSDAAKAVRAFADALSSQDTQAAAELTTSPSQAAESLGETFAGMHAKTVDTDVVKTVTYSDGTASFTLKTTWHWSEDRTFESETAGSIRELSSGWKVQWEPRLLYPGMPIGGRLQMVRADASPAPTVRSTGNKVFMKMEPVYEIELDPAATKNLERSVSQLAAAIKPIAPLITASVINEKLVADEGQPIIAVTLRSSDMKVLPSDPADVKGVTVRRTGQLVMADRRLSTPLSTGLTNYWQALRDATAGWQVEMLAPGAKTERLAGEPGKVGPDVLTTVNMDEQLTLGDTAVEVAQPATVMTFDARTGGVLAMAQNEAARKRQITADIAYPTGSTLDPVFAAIDQHTPDDDGDKSANAQLNALGLGLTFTVPGVSVPKTEQKPKITAAAFKPQNFTATMLGMGALGVSLARSANGTDSSVAPHVIKGAETKVAGGSLGSFDPAVARQIVAAMRTTARTGDASDLTGAGALYALVGTNGPQGPGWFVGVTGDKVLVIYCEGEKSGTAALQVAQKYFRIR